MSTIENRINGGTDIPQELTVSSVGEIVWPPVKASENRKKGIFPSVVEDITLFNQLLEEFETFPLDNQTSRYSARLFTTQQLLRELKGDDKLSLNQYLEGIVPLSQTNNAVLEDCCMIYIGKNLPERKNSDEIMNQELDAARQIFEFPDTSELKNTADFRFETLTETRRKEIEIKKQFYDLYAAFGYVPSEVDEILDGANNVIVAAFDTGTLISSGLGEKAEFFINRRGKEVKFVMYEVTEAATKEDYRRKGLYTHVAIALMRHLAQTNANLIYAESNLEAPGVLKAAKRQGRHSVLETFNEYGFTPRPLQQHVRIDAGHFDSRPPHLKNDLLVTFLPRNELINRYETRTR